MSAAASAPRSPSGDGPAVTIAAVFLALFVVAAALVGVAFLGGWSPFPSPPSSSLLFDSPATLVAPGTVGCRDLAENVCFEANLSVSAQGLTLSDLTPRVLEPPEPNGSWGPELTLGPGASVSALSGPSSIAGVYNLSAAEWSSGSGWAVPAGNLELVLDTGLHSPSAVDGAWWAILGSGPASDATSEEIE